MARHVEDLGLLFNALTGTSAKPLLNSRNELRGLRVAWYTDDAVAPVTEETSQAVKKAAQVLTEAGLLVEHSRPPHVERGYDLWLKLFSRASVVQLRDVYAGHEEEGGGFVRWRLATADQAPAATLDEYIRSWMERDRLRRELLEWMESTPLIVAPIGATPALEHGALKVHVAGQTFGAFRAFSYAQTFNVFDLPCVAVPAGHSTAGLPIGVQIAGRPFAEEQVLAAASIVEEALGGWQPPMSDKL